MTQMPASFSRRTTSSSSFFTARLMTTRLMSFFSGEPCSFGREAQPLLRFFENIFMNLYHFIEHGHAWLSFLRAFRGRIDNI